MDAPPASFCEEVEPDPTAAAAYSKYVLGDLSSSSS